MAEMAPEALLPPSRLLSTVYCLLDPAQPPVLVEMSVLAPRSATVSNGR